MVGNSGGSLKTDGMSVATSAALPVGSVNKETKLGLQVTVYSQYFSLASRDGPKFGRRIRLGSM